MVLVWFDVRRVFVVDISNVVIDSCQVGELD